MKVSSPLMKSEKNVIEGSSPLQIYKKSFAIHATEKAGNRVPAFGL